MFSIPSKNSRVPDSRPYTHFSSVITGQIPRKYKSAKTIAAAIEKGAARGDIMNDFKTLGPRDELCITVTLSRCSVVGLYLDIFRRMIFSSPLFPDLSCLGRASFGLYDAVCPVVCVLPAR